jgi:hypothetical protein
VLRDERRSTCTCNPDLPGAGRASGEAAGAGMEGDLVLLEQIQDAVVVLADHFVLAREHPRHVDRKTIDVDAVLGESVAGVLEILGRLQQRLGRNASDIGAGSAGSGLAVRHRPVVDARGPEAELRRADGRDVAAGTGADDDYVELVSHSSSREPRSQVQKHSRRILQRLLDRHQ